MKVSQIQTGLADSSGERVEEVYSLNAPHYAVYRTSRRVMVHFADELSDQQPKQRAALAQINPLRGQIDGLLDGWQGAESINAASAARADRRIADALVLALEQDLPNATLYLTQLKSDIEQERAARARRFYVIGTATTGAVLLIVMSVMLLLMAGIAPPEIAADIRSLMVAAGAGVLGAFFSSALAIRDRTPMNDLRLWDTVVDAVLRIIIGFIGGMVLYALFRTEVVSSIAFGDGADALDPVAIGYSWIMVAVVGFVAGFVERLVGNLLAKSSIAGASGDARAVPVPPGPPDAGRGRTVRVGTGIAGDASTASLAFHSEGDDAADGCDAQFDPTQETTDEELPAATGGVEERL